MLYSRPPLKLQVSRSPPWCHTCLIQLVIENGIDLWEWTFSNSWHPPTPLLFFLFSPRDLKWQMTRYSLYLILYCTFVIRITSCLHNLCMCYVCISPEAARGCLHPAATVWSRQETASTNMSAIWETTLLSKAPPRHFVMSFNCPLIMRR